jgi:hypothetical protein
MFKKLLATGALALFTLTSTVFAAGAADVTPTTNAAAQAIVAPTTVGPEEAASLQFMREEEKLAHDVYVTLYEQWGLRVFNNISRSEQQHTEANAQHGQRTQVDAK